MKSHYGVTLYRMAGCVIIAVGYGFQLWHRRTPKGRLCFVATFGSKRAAIRYLALEFVVAIQLP